MKFSTWIKKIRLNLSLTQSEFAELLGCSLQSVAYYEISQRYPSIKIIRKLSEVSGVEPKKIRQMIEREKRKKNDINK